jgi:hypothetical protein
MRTRTKNPDGFIDGARRDRCAIVAEAVRAWGAVDTNTAYIERGSPWENGYIESFNARHRDELLDGETFYSLREAQTVIESRRGQLLVSTPIVCALALLLLMATVLPSLALAQNT